MSASKPVARGPLAAFTTFLETDECYRFAESAASQIEDIQEATEGVEWLKSLLSGYVDGQRAVDDALATLRERADQAEGAAIDMRNLVEAYLRHTGAIDSATKAIEAFGASPNAENLAALIASAEAVEGHYIAMPEKLRRMIRPYVTVRKHKSAINFGSLHYIAKYFVSVADDRKAA